jgi:hypothetical protein
LAASLNLEFMRENRAFFKILPGYEKQNTRNVEKSGRETHIFQDILRKVLKSAG